MTLCLPFVAMAVAAIGKLPKWSGTTALPLTGSHEVGGYLHWTGIIPTSPVEALSGTKSMTPLTLAGQNIMVLDCSSATEFGEVVFLDPFSLILVSSVGDTVVKARQYRSPWFVCITFLEGRRSEKKKRMGGLKKKKTNERKKTKTDF
jgi:hypothetical protein